ncbi:MAG TPA: response regulator [Trueperaceae bacterium]
MAPRAPTKTVVVADDQESQRVIFEMMLLQEDFEVVLLADGQEVLNYLKNHTPDILLLDVNMPYLDGLSICDRVKRVPRLKQVPVIIVTSLDEAATKAGSDWVRADALLHKPVGRDQLLRTVRTLLARGASGTPSV